MTDNKSVSGQIPTEVATVVTCGSCGTKLKVRAAATAQNRKGKCPKCGTLLSISLPREAPPAEAPHTAPEPVRVAAAPQPEPAPVAAASAIRAITAGGIVAAVAVAMVGAAAWWVVEKFGGRELLIVKRSLAAWSIGMAVAAAMLVASGRRSGGARALSAVFAVAAIASAKIFLGAMPGPFDPLFLALAVAGSACCFLITQPAD